MAFFLTRMNVGDYDAWKPMFDQDVPGARKAAIGHRVFRGVSNPAEVYLMIEFASSADAAEGQRRLVASGVLDRFPDKTMPILVEEAESVTYVKTPAKV